MASWEILWNIFFSLLFLFFGFGLVVLQMSGGWLSKSLIEDDFPV